MSHMQNLVTRRFAPPAFALASLASLAGALGALGPWSPQAHAQTPSCGRDLLSASSLRNRVHLADEALEDVREAALHLMMAEVIPEAETAEAGRAERLRADVALRERTVHRIEHYFGRTSFVQHLASARNAALAFAHKLPHEPTLPEGLLSEGREARAKINQFDGLSLHIYKHYACERRIAAWRDEQSRMVATYGCQHAELPEGSRPGLVALPPLGPTCQPQNPGNHAGRSVPPPTSIVPPSSSVQPTAPAAPIATDTPPGDAGTGIDAGMDGGVGGTPASGLAPHDPHYNPNPYAPLPGYQSPRVWEFGTDNQ